MRYSTKTLALLPKFTGLLSFLGSIFIIQDVVFRSNCNRVYHRLVLGLSCADMMASVVNILSTWPMPEGSEGVYLASGTIQTCTAQGFFNELGNLATPLYNSSLCTYYVLVICHGWSEAKIRRRAEPLMHAVPSAVAFLIAILGIPFKLYNNSGWLCWIAPYPKGCRGESCERGEHANIFRWVHYTIIWSAVFFVTMKMYSIYKKVNKQDRCSRRWVVGSTDATRRSEKSRKVAVQAALFLGALYLTWIFTTITRIYQIITGKNNFVLLVLMATFFPLQGFFNCLVYLRPRYLHCRKLHPHASVCRIMKLALNPKNDHPTHGSNNAQPRESAGAGGMECKGRVNGTVLGSVGEHPDACIGGVESGGGIRDPGSSEESLNAIEKGGSAAVDRPSR